MTPSGRIVSTRSGVVGFSGPSSAGARLNKVHLAQVVRVAHGVGSFWYP